MSPEELAERHPHLYHVTDPEALPSIIRHGLLSASSLLSLFEISADDRPRIECARRPVSVVLSHPVHGRATINDNLPLSEAALSACLDDELTPRDWLRLLNRRVFLWADEEGLSRLLGARLNRDRDRVVLVLNTLSVARQCFEQVELSPINSGSTLRQPARRGLSTFAPMRLHSYEGWRRLRGRRDRVLEVTVLRGVGEVARHLVEVRHVTGSAPRQG